MLTVLCVLRSGGEYRPEHVVALRDGVRAHLPVPHEFVCLSDAVVHGVWTYPLRYGWPGWWSKMEAFQPHRFKGRVLYMDLDTVIVGDLSDLAAYSGQFAMLSDFLRPERPASGVMAWDAGCEQARAIWEAFTRDPEGHMHECQGGGDQEFIASVVYGREDRLQDVVPGQIVSYKVHCKNGVPDGARLVCAHGTPKPWHAEWRL